MVTLAGEESLRHGITSFQDLGTTFAEVDLIKRMADEGALPVRLFMAFEEQAADMEGRLDDYRMVGYGNNFLTVRTIGEKVLDGALGTHGGWLLEPYSDLPRSYGLNVVPLEEIEASAKLALQHDYQMAIQGIGDRAYRELLDIYEAAEGGVGIVAFHARIRSFLRDLDGPSVLVAHGLLGQVLRAEVRGIPIPEAGALSNRQGCVYLLENGTETVLEAPE